MISRTVLQNGFDAYIRKFNAEDERISLKIYHTGKVVEICDRLSDALFLPENDRDLIWAVGMLHDIGRFEQAAATGSFLESVGNDHAEAGVRYLFSGDHIRDFLPEGVLSQDDLNCIRDAIRYHNKHALPVGLTDRSRFFCNMIRDADKLDIFRVCLENSFEVAHEFPTDTVSRSAVSPEVFDCFRQRQTLDYSKRKEPADIFLGHIAMCFGLHFPESRKIACEQGFIEKMMDFQFADEQTQRKFEAAKTEVRRFLRSVS